MSRSLVANVGKHLHKDGGPHFAHVCRHMRALSQDANGTMQSIMWHRDQKAV